MYIEMKMKNKRILITGGAGFIGSALARRLAKDNEVVIFDNYYRVPWGSDKSKQEDVEVIRGDILYYSSVISMALRHKDTQVIVHCAAMCGVDNVIKHPVQAMEVNFVGTMNILRVAKTLKSLEHFINFSTSEVFGPTTFQVPEEGKTEVGAVGESSRWTYAVSKLAAEHLVNAYGKEFGMPTTTLRPFNVYGPGQIGKGAIQQFVIRAIKGKPLQIHGDGSQIRSWCYIDDMVDAILLCMGNEKAHGEVFNIGNPKATVTILDLAQKVKYLTGSKSKIIHLRPSEVDVGLRIPNIEKAKKLLGFEPKVGLQEGIWETFKYYAEKND